MNADFRRFALTDELTTLKAVAEAARRDVESYQNFRDTFTPEAAVELVSRAGLFDYMLEVAKANGFDSLTDAITKARRCDASEAKAAGLEREVEEWRTRAIQRDEECDRRFTAQHEALSRAEQAEAARKAAEDALAEKQVTQRVGDAYDPNGWQDYEVVSDEAEIARAALQGPGQ